MGILLMVAAITDFIMRLIPTDNARRRPASVPEKNGMAINVWKSTTTIASYLQQSSLLSVNFKKIWMKNLYR